MMKDIAQFKFYDKFKQLLLQAGAGADFAPEMKKKSKPS